MGPISYLIPTLTTGTSLQDLRTRLQQALGDTYRVERELGGGGMSHVFLATEASLNRHVVIKLLPPEMVSEVSSARFKREMEVTAQLHHPHILPVLSAGAKDDVMYYVMPYVEGESLRHRLTREGRLPVIDTLRIMREIADALAFAHRHGVVHRDIKPENILLEGDHAFLADFGVARALINAGGENLTGTGMAVGTQGYMAPEQLSGERNIDARADVYALALVGYEMLVGHSPFRGSSAKAVAAAHLTTSPAPVIEERPEVPLRASRALARALQKEPDDRFQTAGAFRDELEAAAASLVAGRPSGQGRSGASPRKKSALIAVGAVLVVAALAASAFFFRGRTARQLDPDLLVVAPFNVLSPDLTLWKEGIVDVLARNLDGAGPIRTISPSIVVQDWSGHADRQTTGVLARQTGAGLGVFGTLEKFGRDSVRAVLTMFNANSGALLSDFRRSDHIDRMDRLVDSLTVGILRELGRTRPIGSVRLAGIGSNSLPALKAFLQGEQHFRRVQFDSANASYAQAVALDSTFALALYRAGTVRGWLNGIQDTTARQLLIRASAHLQGIGARDSLIILSDSIGRGLAVSNDNVLQNPQLPVQVRRLWEIVDRLEQRYPGDPEALFAIGEARFHHGTRLGRRQPRRAVLDAFDRVIAADSGYAPAYIHAIELAYELGSIEDGLRYVRAYNKLTSGERYADAMRLVERLTDPALAGSEETQKMLDTMTTGAVMSAVPALMKATDSTEAAVRLANEVASRRSGFLRGRTAADGVRWELDFLMYRGHMIEARKLMMRNPEIGRTRFISYMLADVAWFGFWPEDTLRMAAARVADPDSSAQVELAITLGDSAKIAAMRPRLVRRAEEGFPMARELIGNMNAVEAIRRGDTTAALEALTDLELHGHANPLARLLKAEILFARNKHAEALDIVRDGFQEPSGTRVMMALLRGKIAEAAGETALAQDSYALVAQAWRHADPELQHFVEQAKAGLKRLGADERRTLKL